MNWLKAGTLKKKTWYVNDCTRVNTEKEKHREQSQPAQCFTWNWLKAETLKKKTQYVNGCTRPNTEKKSQRAKLANRVIYPYLDCVEKERKQSAMLQLHIILAQKQFHLWQRDSVVFHWVIYKNMDFQPELNGMNTHSAIK